MKINKNEFRSTFTKLEAAYGKDCVKNPIDNLVLALFKVCAFLKLLLKQVIITKEQPEGCHYDEDGYQVVLRIIDGRLIINGFLDAYAWKKSKVESKKRIPCGSASKEGRKNCKKLIETIKDDGEKELLRNFFSTFNVDFEIVHTDSEQRRCVEVTQELYDAGLKYSADEYNTPDKNGDVEGTELRVGDFLVKDGEGAYCVRREEFLLTYTL